MRASTWRPPRTTLGAGLATLVLLTSSGALALDPSLDVSQYAHTAWRIRDGFARGTIGTIAQTPDGYLWLGTEFGLLRFDGVRAVPWHPAGASLPATYITALKAARDGTLWIGTTNGLASYRDGKLTSHPEVTGRFVRKLREGPDGTLWFGAVEPAGGQPAELCAVESDRLRCEELPDLGPSINALYPDRRGNLWVSGTTGVWRWKPGPPERYRFPAPIQEANDLIEEDDGSLLLATDAGLNRLAGGRIRSHSLPGIDAVPRPTRFVRSRDGSLWMCTFKGLLRVRGGRTEVFGVEDGLTHDYVLTVFEDREGALWVATRGGLDRFRDYRFPTLAARQGLSALPWALQATADGSVWIAATDGLHRWQGGHVTFHGRPTTSAVSPQEISLRTVTAREGNDSTLAVDDRGRLWVANNDGVFYLEKDRFVRAPGPPRGAPAWSVAPDRHGGAWVSVGHVGLFHGTRGGRVEETPWNRFGRSAGAAALLQDPAEEGLWLGFVDGGVSRLVDGRVLASYAAADGLGAGRVSHLRYGGQGTVWASTEGGLSRIADGHILTMTGQNGLPCDAVHWSMEDDDHSVWLYMPCGLVRVVRSELDAWVESPDRKVHATVFDASDGVRTIGSPVAFGPPVTKAPDGRIWFTPYDGVTVIDPGHLSHNDLPPPVHIEQITADHEIYDATAVRGGLRLAPGVRDLRIDYTALSLVAPEKIRFRVKLEGQDRDFRDLGNERHVRYTNLPPRSYRFVVKAANDSGVWNEEGAATEFTIPPAFWQTAWFRALGVAGAATLLWAAHLIRVGLVERQQRLLIDAQEQERARIAGELHDGVLQKLSAVTLNLGAVKLGCPPGSPAKTGIAGAQDKLIDIGRDIRCLSHELHSSVLQEGGLVQALSSYCKDFSTSRGIAVSFDADSDATALAPRAALALYRIAQEALGNVAKHAKAKQAHVRLERAHRVVRLTVSDDGAGFVAARAGESGGLGLVSMRERVRSLDGRLAIASEPGRGTTICAEVPVRGA